MSQNNCDTKQKLDYLRPSFNKKIVTNIESHCPKKVSQNILWQRFLTHYSPFQATISIRGNCIVTLWQRHNPHPHCACRPLRPLNQHADTMPRTYVRNVHRCLSAIVSTSTRPDFAFCSARLSVSTWEHCGLSTQHTKHSLTNAVCHPTEMNTTNNNTETTAK